MENKKRTGFADGWHEKGKLSFYVEDGRLVRGTWGDEKTVYPYLPCKDGGYDNASGIKASYRNVARVSWF